MTHFTLNLDDPESLKKLAFLIGDTMRSIDSIALAMVVLGKTFDRFFDDGDSTIGRQCLSGLVEQLDKPLSSCHLHGSCARISTGLRAILRWSCSQSNRAPERDRRRLDVIFQYRRAYLIGSLSFFPRFAGRWLMNSSKMKYAKVTTIKEFTGHIRKKKSQETPPPPPLLPFQATRSETKINGDPINLSSVLSAELTQFGITPQFMMREATQIVEER